ncbi:MAG TPA: undecaprenyl-diphosphatase UppP [Firmicutes bacterium]|jgi:undecaprenyl-diphosphatase|nr:undecaprenyl-diphosphatase UppP [Bacillota bacterium]
MTILQAFILGLAQGLGEFLPISSSAHLILIPWLFKWPDPGLPFDVALHIGTLLAVVAYFWRDWLTLIRHGLGKGFKTQEGKMFWYLVIASIPGAVAGMLLEKKAETIFRSPLIIGIMLILMGVILFAADHLGSKRRESKNISFGQSLWIGISQGLAVIPGVSRSGITMSSGLFLGLTREGAARFSFLLSTPIIAGAGLLELKNLAGKMLNLPFMVGIVTSAVVGFLVIGFLLRWLRKSSFLPFVWYRLLLGVGIIFLFLLRK